MKTQEILNQILGHIRLVHDDKEKLQKILDFILAEIYEEEDYKDEQIKLPKEFERLVSNIADSIDAGLIYYINLETMETEDVPETMDDPENFEFEFGDSEWAIKPKFYNWEKTLRIAPLDSRDSFKIMESFAEKMEDDKFRNQLIYALNNRKPFANFKWKIDNSPYRQDWFDFKKHWLEEHVRKEIYYSLQNEN